MAFVCYVPAAPLQPALAQRPLLSWRDGCCSCWLADSEVAKEAPNHYWTGVCMEGACGPLGVWTWSRRPEDDCGGKGTKVSTVGGSLNRRLLWFMINYSMFIWCIQLGIGVTRSVYRCHFGCHCGVDCAAHLGRFQLSPRDLQSWSSCGVTTGLSRRRACSVNRGMWTVGGRSGG